MVGHKSHVWTNFGNVHVLSFSYDLPIYLCKLVDIYDTCVFKARQQIMCLFQFGFLLLCRLF